MSKRAGCAEPHYRLCDFDSALGPKMSKNDELSFLQEIIAEGVMMNENKAKLCKIPQNPFSLPCANNYLHMERVITLGCAILRKILCPDKVLKESLFNLLCVLDIKE